MNEELITKRLTELGHIAPEDKELSCTMTVFLGNDFVIREFESGQRLIQIFPVELD